MNLSDESIFALKLAVKIAGSQTALAKAIGSQQQNISYWLKKGRPPAEAVIAIEESTGVSRAKLRPDLFTSHRFDDGGGKQVRQSKGDSMDRCPHCLIVLVNDTPPGICYRAECRFVCASPNEDQPILQSSLIGPDYEILL